MVEAGSTVGRRQPWKASEAGKLEEARRAAALRDNLKRRKQQQRLRDAERKSSEEQGE